MTPLRVVSTTLVALAYDAARQQLRVQFHGGACYQYAPVPGSLFSELLAADSKGAFFNRCIRGKFLFLRLAPRFLI